MVLHSFRIYLLHFLGRFPYRWIGSFGCVPYLYPIDFGHTAYNVGYGTYVRVLLCHAPPHHRACEKIQSQEKIRSSGIAAHFQKQPNKNKTHHRELSPLFWRWVVLLCFENQRYNTTKIAATTASNAPIKNAKNPFLFSPAKSS